MGKKTGRPSNYETRVQPRFDEIADWLRNGARVKDLSDRLGVSESCIYQYQNDYPEFSELLKTTRDCVDAKVENALLQAAFNGNITAIIFWLKNRRPDKWHDVNKIDANITAENPFKGLTEKELRALANENADSD